MSELFQIIAREARNQGVISFARFMELALYCPLYGYYEKEADTVGRRGDFYTSASVGGLFGELLAFQFAEWLAENDGPGPAVLAEAGAHDGRLAADILSWLREFRPEVFERVDYWIVEPSARRQEWQRKTLAEFEGRTRWASQLSEFAALPPERRERGVIFSNELLDALPAHRVGWDAANQTWFEWGVVPNGGVFAWAKMPLAAPLAAHPHIAQLPEDLRAVLPDGFTAEICPAAESWWREAAGILQRGKIMTVDYGLSGEDFFAPERSRGTLRAYRNHRVGADLLADPGAQDITAHVNFTLVQKAGETAGLKTETFERQEIFLTRIAERLWKKSVGNAPWNSSRRRQFQTLTHPDHLGRAFRALVQSR